jgi:hypothetical protein
MTDVIAYRGPDDQGHYMHEFPQAVVGLGMRRLAILDLSPLGINPIVTMTCRWFSIVRSITSRNPGETDQTGLFVPIQFLAGYSENIQKLWHLVISKCGKNDGKFEELAWAVQKALIPG